MTINKARYITFRNIENLEISFTGDVNILWGMNAQGKSNILEGIYYFARGKSFRDAKDRDLIKFGEKYSSFEIEYSRENTSVGTSLSAVVSAGGKKCLKRNGAVFRSASEMLGNFKAVLFCPSHLSIVNGGPGERRSFLDIALAQTSPSYVRELSAYRKYLAERNALLKKNSHGGVSKEEWETYAECLSSAAFEICRERNEYCFSLSRIVSDYISDMTSGREKVSLEYAVSLGRQSDGSERRAFDRNTFRNDLYLKLTGNIDRETAVGTTLWGPHRDDIAVSLNGREARLYSSQGQQRSIALAMKLAEGEISKMSGGEYPVFLLDDVFSELDETRRTFLLEKLKGRQIILTSCEPSSVDYSGRDVSRFHVSGGKIIGMQ